ncbi:amino acid adenylation domain-containing protein [Synechococcus sp. EJ6-Ellesmere]|nr:amino acid adenylation domain-containing protein [Synechococcus sp. EJ6-Ellesmere]
MRQLLGDEDASYNVPFSLRLRGQLDYATLESAVNEVVARHEVLRARFGLIDGRPVQYVIDDLHIQIAHILPEPEGVASVISDHARYSFDLSSGPLIKVSLIRLAERDHILLLNMHHIVADGWSLGVFVSELCLFYRRSMLYESCCPPILATQYHEFAKAQAARVESGEFADQLCYWLEQLKNAPSTITWPADYPRPEMMSGQGGQVRFAISSEQRDALKELGAKHGATLFMVLMSAYAVLLNRLTGDADLCIGTPVAGRPSPEVEALIGCFVNTVVIRSEVEPIEALGDLLERIKLTSLEALENQDLPFEVLVEHLKPVRSLGQTPVFQTMMALQNIPISQFDLPGLVVEPFTQSLSIAKFDLNLNLSERLTGLSAILEFNTDIFSRESAEQIALGYQEVLTGIIQAPCTKICDFDVPSLVAMRARISRGSEAKKKSGKNQSIWEHCFADSHSYFQLPRTLPPLPLAGIPYGRGELDVTIGRENSEVAYALAETLGGTAVDVIVAAILSLSLRFIVDAEAVIGVCDPLGESADGLPADCVWLCLRSGTDGSQTLQQVFNRVTRQRVEWRQVHQTGMEILESSAKVWSTPVVPIRISQSLFRSNPLDQFTCLSSLHFAVTCEDRFISVKIQYDLSRFSRDDADAIGRMFSCLLRQALLEPSKPISNIPLLGHQERIHLLGSFRGQLMSPDDAMSLAAPFEDYARQHPEEIALLSGSRSFTYGELNERSSRLAWFLRAIGVKEGDRVAVCMQMGVSLVEALYAVVKVGAAYAPMDGSYAQARLSSMLETMAVTHVVTDRASRPAVQGGDWEVVTLEDYAEAIGASDTRPIELHRKPSAACYIMHTSGTSGVPKAVQFPTDLAIMSMRSLQARYPVQTGDVHIFKTPFTFDVSIWEIFWPLYYGGKLVVAEVGAHRNPDCLLELIENHGVTLINFVPSMLETFLLSLPLGACTSIKWIFSGGERLSSRIRESCFEKLPNARLVNLYGPTETHGVADTEIMRSNNHGSYVPIGTPSSVFQLYLLDEELEPVPFGVPGELYIGNPFGLAHGYLGQPALTAERFIPDPFGVPGSRLYRTGDLCRYYSNGELEFVGRKDRQLKVAGIRIEPDEIEQAILSHPSIFQCVVAAAGEGADCRLVAYVVNSSDLAAEREEIFRHLTGVLPPYLVPSEIVTVDAIPTTPSGKTDLEGLSEERARQLLTTTSAVEPLVSESEGRVRCIFQEALNRPIVDLTASFFELGGHSLMAIQVVIRCQAEFGVKLPLHILYTSGSVKALAEAIELARQSQWQCLVPLATSPGSKPALVFVHGAEGTVSPFYNLANLLSDRFDVFAFQAPGLDGDTEPCSTIAAYCEQYAPIIHSLCQDRQLILIGWSFGGNIALEVAKQLSTQREGPSDPLFKVILLDSFVMRVGRNGATSDMEAAYRLLREFDYPGMRALQQLEGPTEVWSRIHRVLENNLRAFLEYEPAVCTTPIHFLYADEGWPDLQGAPAAAYNDEDRGWGDQLPHIRRHSVPGDHFSLLSKQHSDAVAKTISAIACTPTTPDSGR